MRAFISVVSLCAVTGCASISGSKLQPLSVQSVHDGKEVSGAACTLTNDVGKWFVTTPGSVTVNKSTDDLAVDCVKEGNVTGHEMVVSKANGSVWGNIILGGGIGYVVDRNTGAGFDYPNTITVMLKKMGDMAGSSKPPVQVAATAEAPDKTPVKADTPATK